MGEDDITKPGEVVWEGGYTVPYIYIYIYEKWTAELKNNSNCKCSSVHIVNVLRWNALNEILMHDDFTCLSQFQWNLKSIFSCSHDNLFFEAISHKLITL